MNIIDRINSYLENPYVMDKRGKLAHYPSEASVISRLDGKVVGKCHRATYYRWIDKFVTNPVDARGLWTMKMGNMIEAGLIELCKQIGIWAGDHVKFYDVIHNISGEVDLFVFNENKEVVGCEIKTAYGYAFQHQIMKFPKTEHLMQAGIYLDYFQIPEWHLIYKARDTQEDIEYVLTMKQQDNNKILMVNHTIPVHIFYMEDIYQRFNQLGEYMIKRTLPPNDYVYGYSLAESEKRFETGEISKTRWASIKSGKITDSDWQCVYCQYLDECWKDKRVAQKLKPVKEEVNIIE